MPRAFTRKERIYMARLAARNHGDDYNDAWDAGLDAPMPADERMRRHRIREKADDAIRDLVIAAEAGVLDDDPGGTFSAESMAATFALAGTDCADDRFRIARGPPPESGPPTN